MFEIYNLEKVFLRNTSKDEKNCKCNNFIDGLQGEKIRLEDFYYNVKHYLRNEIISKSIVIRDFGVDTINDKGQLFNMT